VLNPIQVTARDMDPAELKAAYGDSLAFCGGIDQRVVLPQGSVADVEDEVRRRIAQMGAGGGYLAAPTHDVQADTPVENVLAVWEACRRWGAYPPQAILPGPSSG
jgi:uroporphyrinogen decarboxylase